MDLLRIFTLGGLRLLRGDEPVARFETRKAEALLVYLACNRRAHPREMLADLLWDERSQDQALSNLRGVLTSLKKQLEPYLTITRESVALNPEARVWIDVSEFETHLNSARKTGEVATAEDARQVEQTVALYQGEFLEGFFVRESRGFDEWLVRERERLHRLAVDALHGLIGYDLQSGDYPAGLVHATRLLALDPLDELAHRQMMQVLAYSGKRSEALAQYEACRKLLRDELSIEPSAATQALYEQIRTGELVRTRPPKRAVRGYKLGEPIGIGSYGAVYRAYQPAVGREVAVKVILPQYANEAEFIRRFEAEAQIVARLEHPHIVPLYDYWREPDGAYLVMRLLKGGSLEALLGSGPLETGQVVEVVDQVAAGLALAHRQGVVHRDIKPANILLDEAGNAYLTDFGIAKVLGGNGHQTQAGVIFGTPSYISPEQIRGLPVTPQSDIYSLGVVLYEMLTGKAPFPDEELAALIEKHLNQPLPSVCDQRPDLPEAVDQVIQLATAKDPADRYPDALALATAFRQALSGIQLPALEEAISAREIAIEVTNPYKGLSAFQEADADEFFGREAMVGRLVARLGEAGALSRFLAVVGPSGSGKSSLVKAGLIPAFRRGALPGSERWYVVEMLPGSHPFEELEISLLRIASSPTINLMEQLQRDERGILRAARLALPSEASELLLVIDQFEEVFTLVEEPAEARRFLESLYAAVTDPRSPVRVVVSLRADFFDRPLTYPDFSTLLQERTEVVVPLSVAELESAIRSPAERVGVEVEPGLVTAMVAEVREQPGALPLLQFALTELFERREDHRLTLEGYQSIGGVEGVLDQRAEAVFAGLSEAEKLAARQVFLRLVTLGEGVEDTRRRVLRSELEALEHNSQSISYQGIGDRGQGVVALVLEAFGRARLLSFDRDALTRSPTVEIAHEALLREWGRLRGWLDESRSDVRMQRLLGSSAAEWIKADRDPSFLLHGSRLEQFDGWATETNLALTSDERAYLDASLAEREAQRITEEARKRREAALERRSRNFLHLLVVVLLLATLGSLALAWTARQAQIFAEGQSQARATQQAIAEAEADGRATQQALAETEANTRATAEAIAVQEKDKAQQQADLATSRELAVMAINNLEADPERSILLALYALRIAYTRQAEDALHLAVQASRVRMALRGDTGGMRTVEYSPDGMTIATANYANKVTVWDAGSGQELFSLPGQVARYSPDGKRLATGSQDGVVAIWDLATRKELLTLSGHRKEVEDVHFSRDGKLLVSSSLDNTFIVWETETGREMFSSSAVVVSDTLYNVAFSPDGKLLFSIDFYDPDKVDMKVWGVDQDWTLLNQIPGHSIVVPSPDGRWLAASGGEQLNGIYLWDLSKLSGANLATLDLSAVKPIQVPAAHGTLIVSLGFSRDGKLLASTGLESTAKIWQITSDGLDPLLTLSGHTKIVGDVAFSPDGTRLATASQDGSVRVWDITPAGNSEWFTIAAHTDRVFSPKVTADGRYLATASLDGNAKVWDLASGRELVAVTGDGSQLHAVAISPDGTMLATAGSDNLARVWKLNLSPGAASAELLHTLSGHAEGPPVGGLFPGLTTVAFSPDGTKLATGGADGMAKEWDTQTGKELLSVQAHPDGRGVTRLVFSPDGRLLATAADESPTGLGALAKIWDVSNGHEISTFTGHSQTGRIWGLAFSPDGKRVATGGWGGLLKIWDTTTGQELLNIAGHTSTVTGAAFSPDGKYLATSSVDGTVRVWDAASGEELRSYTSPSGSLLDVVFTPDGKKVIASSGQGFVYGYVFDLQDLINLANSRLTRWFTLDECRQFLHREDCPTP